MSRRVSFTPPQYPSLNPFLQAKVEEVKYSGSGVGGGRRLVDEFEARLADANASCERAQKKYERVAKILVNMKAGTQHVADKLEVIKTDQARVSC
jgi:hypothetical protein